jgi:hypothetical protein
MKTETYYQLKTALQLQHEINLQELELKYKQSSYDTNESSYNDLQQKIHKFNLLKQGMTLDICKLELELYKTTNKLE